MDNVYHDTLELIEVIETIRSPERFFLSRYFRAAKHFSTKEEIAFDEVFKGLPIMAPFVSPVVAAKPQRRQGFSAKSFKPAYLKPKHSLVPGDFVKRLPGEPLLGNLSPAERRDRAVIDILETQKAQIESRWEWMAAHAVVNGKVIVSGEDYQTVEVDFGRDAANDIELVVAADMWSDADADIVGQFEDWSQQLLQKSGYAGTDIVMSPENWKLFRNNNQVKADADLRRGISNVPNLQGQKAMENAQYKGKWGEFDLWTYQGRFVEQDGTTDRVLGAQEIFMTAPPAAEDGTGGVHGIPAFGAILDDDSMQPIDIFPKQWKEDDPSVRQIMSQSAPLMIPGRPDATLKVKVR